MRRAFLRTRMLIPTASAVAALSVVLAGQDQPKQPAFRSGASTVAVYTTVTDSTGRLVPNLTKDDFEIYDNGKLQPITLFQTETQPLSIVVMLDRSGSMKDNFRLVALGDGRVRQAAAAGRQGPHRQLRDKIVVEPRRVHERSQDADRHPAQPSSSPTARRRSGTPRTSRSGARAPGRPQGRAALHRRHGQPDELQDEQPQRDGRHRPGVTKEDVMIYTIGLESRMPYGRRQAPLGGGGSAAGSRERHGMTQRPDPGCRRLPTKPAAATSN